MWYSWLGLNPREIARVAAEPPNDAVVYYCIAADQRLGIAKSICWTAETQFLTEDLFF